jgi:hypothetical protein
MNFFDFVDDFVAESVLFDSRPTGTRRNWMKKKGGDAEKEIY